MPVAWNSAEILYLKGRNAKRKPLLMKNLSDRQELPEALRVLLDEYPRESWESSDNFGALIRFWLDRHMMFRKLMASLQDETERALDGNLDARMLGNRVSRYGSMLVGELHGHHNVEDVHYFPRLRQLDARIETGFDLLDSDHHALDGMIEAFTGDANKMLGAVTSGSDWRAPAEVFRKGLIGFERNLDRHLVDEEDLIVPVLLKYAPADLM
jgi:iron-sulfur cluster repair protein YtfE (RIC family)